MMNRKEFVVSVRSTGSYTTDRDPTIYVQVAERGRENSPILRSENYAPGPDLLQQIDRAEMFVRHVMDGAAFYTAYLTAYPD